MILKFLLWPLALLYGLVTSSRNFLYNRGMLKSRKVEVPVISVGNITAGGTGKTPFIGLLIEICRELGIRVAVVSRGYRGDAKTPGRVDLSLGEGAVGRFGDEACMLAWKYPDAVFFIGADRVAVCRQAIAEYRPQLILADDAFQHRRLRRDLDVLLLDATAPLQKYSLLPVGRGRERFRNIRRAQYLIFSKTNLAAAETLKKLEEKVRQTGWQGRGRAQAEFRSQTLRDLSGNKRAWRDLQSEPCLLVCGVGNPESFEKLVQSHGDCRIVERMIYPDHFSYTAADIGNILERKERCRARWILCTEKDGIKLRIWADRLPDLLMTELSVSLGQQRDELLALVSEICQKNDIESPS